MSIRKDVRMVGGGMPRSDGIIGDVYFMDQKTLVQARPFGPPWNHQRTLTLFGSRLLTITPFW